MNILPQDQFIRDTLKAHKLTMTARMVMIKLVLSSSKDGTIGIGLNLLAEILVTDRSNVRRAIKELVTAGALSIAKGGGKGRGDRSLFIVKKGGWGTPLSHEKRGAGETQKGGLGNPHEYKGIGQEHTAKADALLPESTQLARVGGALRRRPITR
jgi:hypothetical protein